MKLDFRWTGLNLSSPSGQRCHSLAGERSGLQSTFPKEANPPWSSFPGDLLGFAGSLFSQAVFGKLLGQALRRGDEAKGCPEESGEAILQKVGGTSKSSSLLKDSWLQTSRQGLLARWRSSFWLPEGRYCVCRRCSKVPAQPLSLMVPANHSYGLLSYPPTPFGALGWGVSACPALCRTRRQMLIVHVSREVKIKSPFVCCTGLSLLDGWWGEMQGGHDGDLARVTHIWIRLCQVMFGGGALGQRCTSHSTHICPSSCPTSPCSDLLGQPISFALWRAPETSPG